MLLRLRVELGDGLLRLEELREVRVHVRHVRGGGGQQRLLLDPLLSLVLLEGARVPGVQWGGYGQGAGGVPRLGLDVLLGAGAAADGHEFVCDVRGHYALAVRVAGIRVPPAAEAAGALLPLLRLHATAETTGKDRIERYSYRNSRVLGLCGPVSLASVLEPVRDLRRGQSGQVCEVALFARRGVRVLSVPVTQQASALLLEAVARLLAVPDRAGQRELSADAILAHSSQGPTSHALCFDIASL